MESTTGHSSRRWLIDSLFPLHMQHLEGPLIPLVCNLSQVRMRHLSMSQQKAATFGHHPPPHIFPHLASRSRFWVPVTRARACLRLKFPVLDYPHLSLFRLSFLVIFLELSSAMKSSAFSSRAFDLHQLLSFQDLKIQSLSLGSSNSATMLRGWFWIKELRIGDSSFIVRTDSCFQASLANFAVLPSWTSQKLCFLTNPLFSYAAFHILEPGRFSP